MTERKVIYMDDSFGYHTEQDTTSDTFNLYGVTIGAGNLALSGNRITGLPNTPSDGQDAVNQNYVDNIASGLQWRTPVAVHGLVGNAGFATLNGLTPTEADAYVVTDTGTLTAGSVSVTPGDLVQYDIDSSIWVLVVPDSGGFVPADTRVTLSTVTALITPYTDATDDGKIVEFSGSSNTGADTSEATDGSAVLVTGEGAYHENAGFVFDGTVPTGSWVQFTGAGQVVAGAGLDKSGNTIFVGNGDGIKVNADTIEVELSASNPGLELTGTSPNKTLQALVGGANGIVRGATGLELEIDDTPDTLDVDADGLKVVGLPEDFMINDVATHYDDAGTGQVTSANLDTLTAGAASNADSLHTHASSPATEAPRVEDTHTNDIIIADGDAVCWSTTADGITKADNSAIATSRVIGIARTGGAADATSEVVKHGVCAGPLSGATVNIPYFLGATGARVVFGSIPTPGRVIRLGFAKNATDLDVQIMDLGYKR